VQRQHEEDGPAEKKSGRGEMRAAHLQTHLGALELHQDAVQTEAMKEHKQHQQQGPNAERCPRLEFVGNFQQQRRKAGQGSVPSGECTKVRM